MSAVLPSDAAGSTDHGSHHPCAIGDEPRHTSIGAGAVAAAVVAQGAALATFDRSGEAAILIAITVAAACAAACAAAWTRRRRMRHADVVIATAAFGGLGMMIGGWIACAASMEGMHHGMTMRQWITGITSMEGMDDGMMHCMHIVASPFAAMGGMAPGTAAPFFATGVMLLTCVAACEWTCAPLRRGGWMRRLAMHAVVASAMLAGMSAAGAVFGHVVADHGKAAMHAAMVLGMALGAGAAATGMDRLAATGNVRRQARRTSED